MAKAEVEARASCKDSGLDEAGRRGLRTDGRMRGISGEQRYDPRRAY